MNSFSTEIAEGERFQFGKNWSRFLERLDDERIAEAEKSLREMLDVETLAGKKFLDIGCGSGLFSLAARRLGAEVHSFDYDPQSVACCVELKRRYFDGDALWTIEHGSALDQGYLEQLGRFDVVYSWGVLHHTGDMWLGLANAAGNVALGGSLFISIYNDQGMSSRIWRWIKKTYCRSNAVGRAAIIALVYIRTPGVRIMLDTLRLKPLRYWREYKKSRGMSPWTDLVDWVGGYPFEVAKPDEIFAFYRERGFQLETLKTVGRGYGCNQYVFSRPSADADQGQTVE